QEPGEDLHSGLGDTQLLQELVQVAGESLVVDLLRMVELVLEGHLCSSAGRLSGRLPATAGSPPPLEVDPLEVPAATRGHAVDPSGRGRRSGRGGHGRGHTYAKS